MQVISASLRTGGRTTHLCNTEIERVVQRRELPEHHLTEMTGEWRSENLTNFDVLVWAKYIVTCYNLLYTPSYDNNLAWEMVRFVGIIFLAIYFSFLVVASERHLTENNGGSQCKIF